VILSDQLLAPVETARWRWRELFEQQGSVRAVALMRIALGPVTLLHLRPFLRDARAGVAYDDHFWAPYLDAIPHLPGGVWRALVFTGAVAAVLLTIGLWTRLSATITFAVVATNLALSQTHFRHNRAFLAILLGGLVLLPAGRVLSVDAWRRRRQAEVVTDLAPLWPLWLLRAQVTLVYLASGISKLVDPDWRGGLVLWDRVVRYRHVLDPTPLPEWAIDVLTSRWLYFIVGPAAVLTEIAIGLGLWFRRTRLAAVWLAIVFHVAIEVSAHVEVFSYAAIAALAIWVTPGTGDRVVRLDPTAPSGRRLAALIRVGDWFGRFRLTRAGPGEPVTVIDRDATVRTGRSGVLLVLNRLPLTFALAAPVLALAERKGRDRGRPRR